MNARAWVWLAAAVSVACDAAPRNDDATASTTIVVARDGTVWLTSPDDDRLVSVDPVTLTLIGSLPTAAGPSHLALDGDALLVTHTLSDRLLRLGRDAQRDELLLPCAAGGPVVAAGTLAVVACELDRRLVAVDLQTFAVIGTTATDARPTSLLVVDGTLYVGDLAGRVTSRRLDASLAFLATTSPELPTGVAARIVAFAADADRRSVAYVGERIEHDGDRERAPEDGAYGSVPASGPRVQPILRTRCFSDERYARLGDPIDPRRHSGPVALATDADRGRLWVVHRGTSSVAVIDCASGAQIARFDIGEGARGIALAPDGVAFVDVGFDHAVARLDIGAANLSLSRPTVVTRLSSEAERGRRLFHDARTRRVGPADVLSCATCHPSGGDDGLTWFVHTPTIAPKLRRTPPAWGGRAALAPFHADGAFDDCATLASETFQDLMGGTALGLDTQAIAAYLEALPLPPPAPSDDAERARADAFEAAGCATCHPAPLYADGLEHPTDLAQGPLRLDAVFTPSLLGVRARAPYAHDGSAATLADVLDRHQAARLTPALRAAVLEFLERL